MSMCVYFCRWGMKVCVCACFWRHDMLGTCVYVYVCLFLQGVGYESLRVRVCLRLL